MVLSRLIGGIPGLVIPDSVLACFLFVVDTVDTTVDFHDSRGQLPLDSLSSLDRVLDVFDFPAIASVVRLMDRKLLEPQLRLFDLDHQRGRLQ